MQTFGLFCANMQVVINTPSSSAIGYFRLPCYDMKSSTISLEPQKVMCYVHVCICVCEYVCAFVCAFVCVSMCVWVCHPPHSILFAHAYLRVLYKLEVYVLVTRLCLCVHWMVMAVKE